MINLHHEQTLAWGLIVGIVFATILGMSLSLKPVLTRLNKQRIHHDVQTKALKEQRQRWQSSRDKLNRLSLQIPVDSDDVIADFSPLAFKALENVEVIGWQPQGKGGALRLALDWRQVQPVMHHLELNAAHIDSLIIQPVKSRLSMSIRLSDE